MHYVHFVWEKNIFTRCKNKELLYIYQIIRSTNNVAIQLRTNLCTFLQNYLCAFLSKMWVKTIESKFNNKPKRKGFVSKTTYINRNKII